MNQESEVSADEPAAAIGHRERPAAVATLPRRSMVSRAGLVSILMLTAGLPAAAGSAGGPPAPGKSTGNLCHRFRPRLRCPDLVMSAPADLHLDRSTRPGHTLLRATSSINNRGTGPLEVRAIRVGPHRWRVYQALYDARGRIHFDRIRARLVYHYVPGARYEAGDVGAASYWKFRHAAGMQLWSVDRHDRPLRLVRTGPKLDYCLRDLRRTKPLRRSPGGAVYGGCSEDPRLRRDILGTSVGWSDIYPYEYPQQWVDVSGLHGRFALVFTVDPDHLLVEANHRNDVAETYVQLPSGRVLGHRGPVSHP